MKTLDELQNIVEKHIGELPYNKEPIGLYSPIKYTLEGGGKRLRPLVLLISAEMFGGNIYKAINAALAIEVFHNFTLLHDDIMDEAPQRRGRSTVHIRWSPATAILSGDAMVIEAYRLLSLSPDEHLQSLLECFGKLAIEVCEGQQYDMDFEHQEDISLEMYKNMITLKTSVLIAGAAQMGAIIGGASKSDAERLYRFALNLGVAFQIQDDLLDTYGNSSTFGKTIGGDIIVGKKTFLLITALEKASKTDAEQLRSILKSEMESATKISTVKEIYNKYNVAEIATTAISEYYTKAENELKTLSIGVERCQQMRNLAEIMLKRDK